MYKRGFTLIELLVVIAIIGILSAIVIASLSNARDRANTAMRLESAKQVQNAIEIYFTTVGNYPVTGGSWSSTCSAWGSRGASASDWIPGLSPTYIPTLPKDPNSDGASRCCYLYRSDGKDYKFLIGYSCQAFVPSGTYNSYPSLVDPARDGGPDSSVVDGDGTGIYSWAIYTRNAAMW